MLSESVYLNYINIWRKAFLPTHPGQHDVNIGMGSSWFGWPSRCSAKRCSSSVPSSMIVRSAANKVSAAKFSKLKNTETVLLGYFSICIPVNSEEILIGSHQKLHQSQACEGQQQSGLFSQHRVEDQKALRWRLGLLARWTQP